MSISLNEDGAAFISKILVAGSQEEVKNLIDDSLKSINQPNMNPVKVAGFVNSVITQLEEFSPLNKDAGHWGNINMARIHLQHIKRSIEFMPCKA